MPLVPEALGAELEAAIAAANVPGLAVGVVARGEVVYAQGFGTTSVEDGGVPVTPTTLFRIGSTTKVLTGIVLMNLVRAGKVDLDRPVCEYIDGLRLSDPEATTVVTLRHLMSHRSGLPSGAEHYGRRDPEALGAFVREAVPNLPLVCPPGAGFCYSNPGIDVAGYIAEVVGGKPYTELVKDLIFDPLGMGRSTYDPTVAMTYPLAQSHRLGEDGELSVLHRVADNAREYPAGFVFSTVQDMSQLLLALLGGGERGGVRIIEQDALAEMATPLGFPFGALGGYGLTLQVSDHKGHRRLGHNGSISSFVSAFDFYPDDGVGVVVLQSRGSAELSPEELAMKIVDQVLDLEPGRPKLMAPTPCPPDESRWKNYTGTYLSHYMGEAKVVHEDGALSLIVGDRTQELTCVGEDTYVPYVDGQPSGLVYFMNADEPVEWIQLNGMPARRHDDDKTEVGAIGEIAGAYAGAGLQVQVEATDGTLVLTSEALDPPLVATPIGATRFSTALGVLEYFAGEDGQPDKLTLADFEVARVR